MAIIKYGAPAPAIPKTPARVTPKRVTPARVTPARVTVVDPDAAGSEAGGDFTVGSVVFPGKSSTSTTSAIATTNYKTKVDKATAARNRAQADYIRGLLGLKPGETPAAGAYDKSINETIAKINAEETRQLGDVAKLYGTVGTGGAAGTGFRGDVQKAYGLASGQVTAGYDTLRKWLQDNAPTAYAKAPAATATPVSNALAAYQAAQGVSSAPVDAQIAAMNVAAGGGAANYNNLLEVLKKAEESAQTSRLAEEQMARLATGNTLTAAQTAALANLLAQQTTAENAVRGQFGQQRLTAEQARIQRRTGLEDLLRSLVGY